MKPYIVCTGTNGRAVIFGYAESEPQVGEKMELHNARMVLYWPSECNGLFGLATNGPKQGLRLSPRVAKTTSDTITQVVSVTQNAAREIDKYE